MSPHTLIVIAASRPAPGVLVLLALLGLMVFVVARVKRRPALLLLLPVIAGAFLFVFFLSTARRDSASRHGRPAIVLPPMPPSLTLLALLSPHAREADPGIVVPVPAERRHDDPDDPVPGAVFVPPGPPLRNLDAREYEVVVRQRPSSGRSGSLTILAAGGLVLGAYIVLKLSARRWAARR